MTRTGRPRAMGRLHKQRALQLASEGRTRKQIAQCLGVSPRTLRREVARDAPFAEVLREAETRARRMRRKVGRFKQMRQLSHPLPQDQEPDDAPSNSTLPVIPRCLQASHRRT